MNVIYMLTFPSNKSYIGKTKKGITHRFKQHVLNAVNNRQKSPYVENAIRKYGESNIVVQILLECESEDDLSFHEIALIKEHNTLCPNGYNLTEGGDGNSCKHTDEFKLQKSKHMRKNHADKDLEMYVKYTKTKNGTEGYIVVRPGSTSAQFCSPDLSMDEKREKANDYAKALARGEIININRYKHVDIGIDDIPKGISYLSKFDGFRVTPPGKPTKWFKSQSLNRFEKYALALKYYNEQTTEKLNGRMLAGEVDLQNDDAQDMA